MAESSDEDHIEASPRPPPPPPPLEQQTASLAVGGGDQQVDPDDHLFELSVDEMVHDFDDEQTLAEEEALATASGEQVADELDNLQKVRK